MKFDLTNIFDLLADPLSRLNVKNDFFQEMLEKVLGDEKKVVYKGSVLEVIDLGKGTSAPSAPTAGSETRYAIRARIEELHGSVPLEEYITQKKPNGQINKLIDTHEIIYSVDPTNSGIGATGEMYVPKAGDVVEIIEVDKNTYRFGKKLDVNENIAGFVKVTDPALQDSPSTFVPSLSQDFQNGQGYNPNALSGPASAGLNDQGPVKEAALAGDFYENRGLPCSGYVAIWVMNQLGLKPQQSQWRDWKAWSRLDINLWKTINLVGGDLGDTYNIDEIQKRLGGSVSRYSESQTLPKPGTGPVLTPGRWHVVQHWCPPGSSGGYPSGHIYLIYWDGSDKVLKWHSSHRHRYREETKSLSSWWGGGCKKAIVTLPIGDMSISAPGGSFSNIVFELESKIPIQSGLITSLSLNDLTARVEQEYTLWSGKKETDPTVYEVLKKYWDNIQYGTWTPSGTPWSASFISWIVGDSTFPKAAAHRLYAESALNNRLANNGSWHLFSLMRETPVVAIGDVMVRPRDGSYTNTHGDIVWKIENNTAYLAGGNLSDTMKKNITISLNDNNTVKDPKGYKIILKKVV